VPPRNGKSINLRNKLLNFKPVFKKTKWSLFDFVQDINLDMTKMITIFLLKQYVISQNYTKCT